MIAKKLKSTVDCAEVFRALGDETRIRILRALEREERCVTDLCEELGLEQHFASRHLAVLRHVGLVVSRREAQRVFYSLGPNGLDFGCCEVKLR